MARFQRILGEQRLSRFHRKKGSAFYEIIIKTLVFITLIATAISFFSIFTVYLNLNYTCRRVVREIEISGQVTSSTTALFNQIKSQTNIGPVASMEIIDVSYFNPACYRYFILSTNSHCIMPKIAV